MQVGTTSRFMEVATCTLQLALAWLSVHGGRRACFKASTLHNRGEMSYLCGSEVVGRCYKHPLWPRLEIALVAMQIVNYTIMVTCAYSTNLTQSSAKSLR